MKTALTIVYFLLAFLLAACNSSSPSPTNVGYVVFPDPPDMESPVRDVDLAVSE